MTPPPDELPTEECEGVLDALAAAGDPLPHVIFTGDPLLRPDLVHLVRHASGQGLEVSLAPAATPRITRDLVHALKAPGLAAMALSVDGPAAAQHDGLRGVLAGFGWTLAAAQHIAAADISLEVNTLVTADTQPELEEIAKLVARLGAGRWRLAFPSAWGAAACCGSSQPSSASGHCAGSPSTPADGLSRSPRRRRRSTSVSSPSAHDTGETRAQINASATGRPSGCVTATGSCSSPPTGT